MKIKNLSTLSLNFLLNAGFEPFQNICSRQLRKIQVYSSSGARYNDGTAPVKIEYETPLLYAMKDENLPVISELVEFMEPKDIELQGAVQFAFEHSCEKIVDLLLPKATDKDLQLLFTMAARERNNRKTSWSCFGYNWTDSTSNCNLADDALDKILNNLQAEDYTPNSVEGCSY